MLLPHYKITDDRSYMFMRKPVIVTASQYDSVRHARGYHELDGKGLKRVLL